MTNPIIEAFDALVPLKSVSEDTFYIYRAAQARVLELDIQMRLLQGVPLDLHHKTHPLSLAVNDLIKSVEVENNKVLDENTDDAHVEAILIAREDVDQHLDNARVASLAMLAHLSAALKSLPNLTVVK